MARLFRPRRPLEWPCLSTSTARMTSDALASEYIRSRYFRNIDLRASAVVHTMDFRARASSNLLQSLARLSGSSPIFLSKSNVSTCRIM